ncbi:MAG: aconitate hydratase B, partial [Pseudomonadota bacterium]|nr:aconitate hydratase B [Pseudomonadota bacterium]
MLEAYREHVAEREALGIPPKPLNAEQTAALVELLKNPPAGEEETLVYLLENRIPPGVDEAAYVKAAFLTAVVKGEASSPLISKEYAVKLLGMMQGGYNIATLVDLLDNSELAELAGEQLKKTLLMFDAFNDVKEKMDAGNDVAKAVVESWANAEWFTNKKKVPESMKMVVFKVTGETNTDDLSPAPDAWSRPDIPLHARAMYKMERDGLKPEEPGVTGPIKQIEEIQSKGLPVAFVGDVVGTGSSRKSGTNSVLWYFGEDIPGVPNKRAGGVCIGNKVAPIFFNTMEDAGALVFEAPVDDMNMGDVIEIRPYEGKVLNEAGETISEFKFKSDVILDEVQAGGRIPLIIGRGLTNKARQALGMGATDIFRLPKDPEAGDKGFTLAQKMVGKACGLPEGKGVRPNTYCEPHMTTVGSQDTTGPMTRDELKDLACLGFQA